MQAALDYLMPFTQEWFAASDLEKDHIDLAALKGPWQSTVSTVMAQATLQTPADSGFITCGKQGQHSEHLSYLLTEMQSLARAHPEATW
jgi:ring-1,2-phenylacetyl-CoA epoxidase subunit PaaC